MAADGGNLWKATAGAHEELPPLSGDIAAQTVVIGGGFTGLSTALHLAQTGHDVQLLEAQTIGYGGSGRNVGLVNAGLWTPPDQVEDTLGVIAGAKLNEILAAGPELVFSLINKFNIECEAVRNGTLHCADSKAGFADLEERFNQQKKRGAPVELLNATLTRKRTGSRRFLAALHDRRAGTIQPLAYARGLARAAIAAGATLHEGTPVKKYRHDGSEWRVETKSGTVTTPNLVLATNAYASRRIAARRSAFIPLHYFQASTEPLDDDLRQSILPNGEGCWDTGAVMSSFRVDASGRLVIGSVGALKGFAAKTHLRWARRKLRWLYPALGNVPFSHIWHGRIAMTSDHMPKIAEIGPGGIAIFGYNGRGIAPGTVFGRAAAEWIVSQDQGCLPIAPEIPRKEAFTFVKRKWYEYGAAAAHYIGSRRDIG